MLKVLVSCFKLKHETYFSPILPAWKEVFTSQSHMSALQCKDKQYTTTATLTVHIIHKLLQTYQLSCLQRDSHTLQVILMLSQSDAQISCLFQRMPMPTLNHSLFISASYKGLSSTKLELSTMKGAALQKCSLYYHISHCMQHLSPQYSFCSWFIYNFVPRPNLSCAPCRLIVHNARKKFSLGTQSRGREYCLILDCFKQDGPHVRLMLVVMHSNM